MKKLVLVTVIAILGFANVNAQEIKFGAKAGLNFAFITGDNTGNFNPTTDFNFGLLAEVTISEKFSFQPELIYSRQGCNVALNYLNVPLMGKYYLTKGLSLEAGPQIGFLLSAKKNKIDVKNSFNTIDLGVGLGVGYEFESGLNLGVRYNLGLSDINNIDGFSDKNKNGVFQLSIGYFFF